MPNASLPGLYRLRLAQLCLRGSAAAPLSHNNSHRSLYYASRRALVSAASLISLISIPIVRASTATAIPVSVGAATQKRQYSSASASQLPTSSLISAPCSYFQLHSHQRQQYIHTCRMTTVANPAASAPVHELDRTDIESYMISGGKVFERFFDCPLDYAKPDGQKIRVFVRHIVPLGKEGDMHKLPFMLYLQGGPGFECRFPGSVKGGWYATAISEGYQILLIDQRGTGLSTPINAGTLDAQFATAEEKADYVSQFRADNIVRDCEHVRKVLCQGRSGDSAKLALLGQSFGGFCITTFLSMFPESISKAFITGGVPPLVDNPDAVYQATYRRMVLRNKQYYEKYPRDVERVRNIIEYLNRTVVSMPDGGVLSPRRFQQLGLNFGFTGGFDQVHQLVLQAYQDLANSGFLSAHTLTGIASMQSFDSNPLYCIMHESIYCQGDNSSGWSAHRVREEQFSVQFEHSWDKILVRDQGEHQQSAVYFTGETVYPWMLDDYAELRKLKDVANLLAARKNWPKLYNKSTLSCNQVPVAGVSYYNDMFVEFALSEQTAESIKGFKLWVTNQYHHNGLRADPKVMQYLVSLLRGDITDL